MSLMKRCLVLVAASLLSPSAQAQEPNPTPAVGETLLHPLSISLGRTSPLPSSATAQGVSVRSIELQIERQRAAEAASAELPELWRASFWAYLPQSTSGTLNSPTAGDDDLTLAPSYLLFSARLLERQVDAADKTTKMLFGR